MKKFLALLCFVVASASAATSWNPGTKVSAGQFIAGPTSGGSAGVSPRAINATDIGGVVAFKNPVELVATTNQSVSSAAATYDGVAPVTSGVSRILLTGQTAPAENGLWLWNGAAAALTRPADYAAASTTHAFYFEAVMVLKGQTLAGTIWYISTTGAITIDSTSVTWTRWTQGNTALRISDTAANNFTTIKQNSDEAADRILNIPALGADDTIVTLATAQQITGSKTFRTGVQTFATAGSLFKLNDSAGDNTIAFLANDETADRTLTIPLLGANKTIACVNLTQTFTATQTFQSPGTVFVDNAGTGAGVIKLQDTSGGNVISIATASDESADRTLNIPLLGGNDTFVVAGTTQTIGGLKTFTSGITLDTINGNTAASTFQFTGKAGSSAAGQAITITSGAGNGAFNGGLLSIIGGASGAGATGNGGGLTFTSGAATSTNGNGGNISITSGAKTGTGVLGQITLGADGSLAQLTGGRKFKSADQTSTSATLANDSHLSFTLVGGRKYAFQFVVQFNNSAPTEGAKFDLGGGSLTATNFRATYKMTDDGTNSSSTFLGGSQTTALATSYAVGNIGVGPCTLLIWGSFEPSGTAAGTFILRIAENSHTSGTLTVFRGSYGWVEDMP